MNVSDFFKSKLDDRVFFNSRAKVKGDEILAFVAFGAPSDKIRDLKRGEFREVLAPNCFRIEPDCQIFVDHRGPSLGSIREGNLKIKSDDQDGLRIRYRPRPEDEDLISAVARGDLDGCSPGFFALRDQVKDQHGEKLRTILEAKLIEISLTMKPAYFEAAACTQLPATRSILKPKSQINFVDGLVIIPVEDRTNWEVFHGRS